MIRHLSLGLLGLLLATIATATAADDAELKTIYGGPEHAGAWMTSNRQDVPEKNLTDEGLNPHDSGGYLVVHREPLKDFVLDFQYKLSEGCNSGVFIRVRDLNDPVNTGLEIAIDDTEGTGMHDSGAIYDLVATSTNPQKPAGEWNHMTITAEGPIVRVAINGTEVSRIDQSEWTEGGRRPDGSRHKFGDVAIKDLEQNGYFGFQDHGQDCWFKDVKVTALD